MVVACVHAAVTFEPPFCFAPNELGCYFLQILQILQSFSKCMRVYINPRWRCWWKCLVHWSNAIIVQSVKGARVVMLGFSTWIISTTSKEFELKSEEEEEGDLLLTSRVGKHQFFCAAAGE